MDPATIIGIASGAAALGEILAKSVLTLAEFIKDNRTVPEIVQNLHDEADGLRTALSAVGSAIIKPEILMSKQLISNHEDIWRLLQTSIDRCQAVTGRLERGLQRIGHLPGDAGILRRAAAQIKLSLQDEEIKELRQQSHVHKLNIQTSLQVLTFACVVVSPMTTRDLLQPQFEGLMRLLIDIQRMLMQSNLRGETVSPPTKQAMDDSERLMMTARATISTSGTSFGEPAQDDETMSVILDRFAAANPVTKGVVQSWIDELDSQFSDTETLQPPSDDEQEINPDGSSATKNSTPHINAPTVVKSSPAIAINATYAAPYRELVGDLDRGPDAAMINLTLNTARDPNLVTSSDHHVKIAKHDQTSVQHVPISGLTAPKNPQQIRPSLSDSSIAITMSESSSHSLTATTSAPSAVQGHSKKSRLPYPDDKTLMGSQNRRTNSSASMLKNRPKRSDEVSPNREGIPEIHQRRQTMLERERKTRLGATRMQENQNMFEMLQKGSMTLEEARQRSRNMLPVDAPGQNTTRSSNSNLSPPKKFDQESKKSSRSHVLLSKSHTVTDAEIEQLVRNGYLDASTANLYTGIHGRAPTKDQSTKLGEKLFKACTERDEISAVTLLRLGADADYQCPGSFYMTPLMIVCMKMKAHVALMLLQNGASVDAQTSLISIDQEPFKKQSSKPCMMGNKGIFGHYRAISYAAANGLWEHVNILLQADATLDFDYGLSMSPLLLAAYFGHQEVVSMLISLGADPTPRSKATLIDTPLNVIHIAVVRGNTAVLSALTEKWENIQDCVTMRCPLARYVDAAPPNTERWRVTAIHLALYARQNSFQMMSFIAKNMMSADVIDSQGCTVLHHWILRFDTMLDTWPETISSRTKQIIDLGVDVNSRDNDGCTALHYLYTKSLHDANKMTDYLEVGRTILICGGNSSLLDSLGRTPLQEREQTFRDKERRLFVLSPHEKLTALYKKDIRLYDKNV